MKTKSLSFLTRATAILGLLAFAVTGVSCTTTYDAYGRPVQSVDPGVAVAGAAAAGLIGYAIADGDDHHRHNDRRYYGRPYRGRGHYHHY